MLDPGDRLLLTDSLRPPPGFQIDHVVSTTYTLDLVTLLTLPLSFTLFASDGIDEDGRVDPIVLLEALRRHAGRITVFCDAGHIAVPRRRELLFAHLEDSVIGVKAREEGGRFHPKVTVVRYIPDLNDQSMAEEEQAREGAVRYRLLCASRNLTFDRSWDTMLVLDGELASDRVRAFARNRPLSSFIETLPRLARGALPRTRASSIKRIADELLRVQFEPPQGFGTAMEDLVFWPMGIEDREVRPFTGPFDRFLVVSPFVNEAGIERILQMSTEENAKIFALISRPEQLDKLPNGTLGKDSTCLVLADAADGEPTEPEIATGSDEQLNGGEATGTQDTVEVAPSEAQLRGLHAKLFVADAGRYARIWTGSANATDAAFTKNVEFLVELRGKKSEIGIDALLRSSSAEERRTRQIRFGDLLAKYHPPDEPAIVDRVQEELERRVEEARRAILATEFEASVVEVAREPKRLYDMKLVAPTSGAASLTGKVECTIRPISLLPNDAKPFTVLCGQLASFHDLGLELLTAFWAVSVTARTSGRTATKGFVLKVSLNGIPEDRQNMLLLAMLSNRERLIRYLLMLLEGPEAALRKIGDDSIGERRRKGGGTWGDFGLPLLEPLLRAVAVDPSRLEHLERLMHDLEGTAEGQGLLPESFSAVWAAVRAAYLERQPREKG